MNLTQEVKEQILQDRQFMREIIASYLSIKQPRVNEIRFRVTEAEEASIQMSAQTLGMTISEYIRSLVLA